MKSHAKKWILFTFSSILILVTILSVTVYIVDPFFQFRVKDNSYMLNERFVSGGLIKNYDYDTLIVGSSMTQNFDMNVFRDELGVNPLHIGLGGICAEDELSLLELAYRTGKANKYYICAEMYLFTDNSKKGNIPKYLLNDDFLSRFRYFLNYEAWFRFIPIDAGFVIADKMGIQLPPKMQFSKSIDRLADWRLDYTFGEEIVIKNYTDGKYGVTEIKPEDLYNRITTNVDSYFDGLQPDKGEHIFFFAPYSMLYWADLSDENVKILLAGQKYFVEKALQNGITVYNFQTADFTADLNNYKDTTHYKPEINDWMTKNFATDDYIVTMENYDEFENKLIEMRKDFQIKYSDLIKHP